MPPIKSSLKVIALLTGVLLIAAACGRHGADGAHTSGTTPRQTSSPPASSKAASVVPPAQRLVARDAGITLSAGGYTLSWEYENPGDYNQDGIVGLEDIAPLSEHFNEAASPANEWIDGSGDGVIGVADITPIAMNWGSEVMGYRIDGADAAEGPWSEVTSLTIDEGDTSAGRLAFTSEIAPGYTYYRIVTLTPDGDATSSEALVAPSNEPIIYSVSPLSGYQHEEYTFTATASGQEPLTYVWDFGGGASPNTSSDISPTVTLSDAGEYSATLTISNSYGPTSFPFTLTVSARDMWVHTWDGPGESSGWGILLDETNLYVAGSGGSDALLMKYSQSGDLLWARGYGVEGSDSIIGCVFDAEGNIIAGGSSYALGEGNTDLMLLKYSPDGDLLRAMTWGTPDYENNSVKGFCTDSQGNIYQCGSWAVYGGKSQILVVKYDPDWNIVWSKRWEGVSESYGAGISVVGDSIYVCGETGPWTSPEHDALLMKMDEDGNVLWARTWGTERSDVFISLVEGQDGSVYAVGNSSGPADEYYGVVVKLSSDGILERTCGWQEAGVSKFTCMTLNPFSGVTVAGVSETGLLLLEMGKELELITAECWFGSLYRQTPNSCIYDQDGNLYITGFSETPFGEWTEQLNLTYEPEGHINIIEGSTSDLNGTSSEPSGIETRPDGAIDTVTANQLLLMKNF